jgi:hypothetical protein
MKCTRVKKHLSLHVAGDLIGRRARVVAKHLTTCEACCHTAKEYDASLNLLRAATLPPEFDAAFYDEIRNNVLAQIKRDRRPASPLSARFSLLFNTRLAYAASMVLIILAALSLHNYTRRTVLDRATQETWASASYKMPVTPTATATPKPIQATTSQRQTSQPSIDLAGGMRGVGARKAKSQLARQRARIENSRSGTKQSLMLTSNTPSNARRSPLALNAAEAKRATNPQGLARGSDGIGALTEVSRIEIQTSDPNIRIIWLAPGTDSAQPLK